MSGGCQRGSAVPSSGNCQLVQDSDDDDVDNGELWNHRPLQHQVGYLSLEGAFSGGLSPQPSSSVECQHRVSPLDPNLSSAARYSPPPPYSSPIDEIEPSIDHQNSPLDHLSHANALSSLPAGVTSSISTVNETLMISESHRIQSSGESSASTSRSCNLSRANSLFSTPPNLLQTQPKPIIPCVTVSEDNCQPQVCQPAESIWAKQKRLALSESLSLGISQSTTRGSSSITFHDANSHHILPQPGPSGLNDRAVPGPSGFQALSFGEISNQQRPQSVHQGNFKNVPRASFLKGQMSPRVAGSSGLQPVTHSRAASSQNDDDTQAGSSNIPLVNLPSNLLSKLKHIPQPHAVDSSSSDDDGDDPDIRLHLNPSPGPSVVQHHHHHLVNLNDSDAEALAGIVSGCEASSSNVQGHISPLRSPGTPADNCIVSSSTGHIDSIPPTPVEFQGNDVSEPNSPVSPSLACAAILDSTVDSTSGRGILDTGIVDSDNDSNDHLAASAPITLPVMTDGRGEISTSEVGLQNSDDSQDVELLVSPQGMFSSGRARKHFIDQISLSFSQFPTNSLDASLPSDRCEPNIPPPSDESYLDDSLAIPGPSGVSLPGPSGLSNSRQSMSPSVVHGLDQPSTSSRQNISSQVEVLDKNLPLLDITEGLACSTAGDTDHLADDGEAEVCPPLVSLASTVSSNVNGETLSGSSSHHNNSPLTHHPSYVLELNDESSISSDALSTSSLGKDDLSGRVISHGTFADMDGDAHHHLLGGGQLVTESLSSSINLNMASSDVTVSVSLSGASQQHPLAQHLISSQPDQVSLLVGGGDESNDGALLMMVSSNGDSLPDALTLGKPPETGDGSNHLAQLSDSDSQMLQSDSLNPNIQNDSLSDALSGDALTLGKSPEGNEDSNHLPQLSDSEQQMLDSESLDQNIQNLHFDKNDTSMQNKNKIDTGTSKDVEAYVEANFWCGECEQMYNIECPQHGMQDLSDGAVKARGWNTISAQQLVMGKVDTCLNCNQKSPHECPHYRIQTISDKPVKTRAWASLPAQHLVIRKVLLSEELGVFARKAIPKRTRFGPLEGMLVESSCEADGYDTDITVCKGDDFLMMDTSEEDCSNWMIFVRRATTYMEQNCVIVQIDGSLYFLTNTDIPPRTELKVGYSKQYADKRNLKTLEPTEEEIKVLDAMRKSWPCYECDEAFETSAELQQHLVCHDEEVNEEDKKKRKKVKNRRPRAGNDPEAKKIKMESEVSPQPGTSESQKDDKYSKQYADKRNLKTLEPTEEEIKVLDAMRKSWPCYECDEAFETSAELQQHLVCHDEEVNEEDKKKRKKVKNRRPRAGNDPEAKKIKMESEVSPQPGTSESQKDDKDQTGCIERFQRSQCLTCNFIFSMPGLLDVHQVKHLSESPAATTAMRTEENGQVEMDKDNENGEHTTNNGHLLATQADEALISTVNSKEISDILSPFNKICPHCKTICDTDEALVTHVEEHGAFHPGSSKPFKCDYCYKSFTRRFRLEAHKSVHGNESDKPFRCNLCLRRFCSNTALTAHIRFHVEGCKGYDCPICREGFFSVAGLKAHVSSHCVNGEYNCPKCNKVFPNYSKIRRHIRSYHAVMPHVCSMCGKEMPSLDKLKIHMLSHSDRRDFLCPDCGKRFKRKDKLREHAKRMHSAEREDRSPKIVNKGPPKFVPKVDPADYKQFLYKCTICMLGFKRRGMLVNHLAKRHPNIDMKLVPELNQPIVKATRCYKCQHCDKRYRSNSKRKLHILKYHPGAELPPRSKSVSDNDTEGSSYTSSYPHPCNWCYRQYASRARLLRHQRHHHASHFNNEAEAESNNGNVAFLDAPANISNELSLNGQIVADANILHNHRLVNIARGAHASGEAEGDEDDLLTQAMGEITPLGARQVLVSGDGGQQGATLALVTTEGPEAVTLSLPNGQLISLIPGLSVAGASSPVTSTSRAGTSGGGVAAAEQVLQREEVSGVPMAYARSSTLSESNNEAEAVEQVVLAAQHPSSPSNQVVWQQALTFSNAPT